MPERHGPYSISQVDQDQESRPINTVFYIYRTPQLTLRLAYGLNRLEMMWEMEELVFDEREILDEDRDWILKVFIRLKKVTSTEPRKVLIERMSKQYPRIEFCFQLKINVQATKGFLCPGE